MYVWGYKFRQSIICSFLLCSFISAVASISAAFGYWHMYRYSESLFTGKKSKMNFNFIIIRVRPGEGVFEIQPQLSTVDMHLSSLQHLVTTLKLLWSHVQINGNRAAHSHVFVQSTVPVSALSHFAFGVSVWFYCGICMIICNSSSLSQSFCSLLF